MTGSVTSAPWRSWTPSPGTPRAQGIGRWGNYFNQELFGEPTRLPWALEIDRVHRPRVTRSSRRFTPRSCTNRCTCSRCSGSSCGRAAIRVAARQSFSLYLGMYTFGRFGSRTCASTRPHHPRPARQRLESAASRASARRPGSSGFGRHGTVDPSRYPGATGAERPSPSTGLTVADATAGRARHPSASVGRPQPGAVRGHRAPCTQTASPPAPSTRRRSTGPRGAVRALDHISVEFAATSTPRSWDPRGPGSPRCCTASPASTTSARGASSSVTSRSARASDKQLT